MVSPMKPPPRSLIIYSIIVLLAAITCFFVARAWQGKGKEELRMKEKQATNQNVSVPSYVAVYGPKALFANSALCLLLLAVGPWATRSMQRTQASSPTAPNKGRRLALAIVSLTLIGSAISVSPRLKHSLWADEATTMRKFVVGEYNRGADGTMALKPVTQLYRQFALKTPNNHMLYSTLAGWVHGTFFTQSDAPDAPYFSETLMRIPAFLFGLGALLAVWWLALEMGLKQMSWLPAVLLALHPWHSQYTGEARGYSMIMALVPFSLAAALAGLRTGRWRWWLLYSLAQVMMVDTWPLAVDVLLTSNAIVFCAIVAIHRGTGDLFTQLGRWAVCCILSAMVALQLLLPAYPQIAEYMRTNPAFVVFEPSALQDAFIMMLTGSRWGDGDPSNPYVISWATQVSQHPLLAGGFLVLLSSLMILGFFRLWRTSLAVRWMACLFIVIPTFIIIHLYLKQSIFLPWYYVPAMPGSLILLSAGLLSLTQRFASAWKFILPAALAIYAIGMFPQHRNLHAAPLQQNREAALLTRNVLNPTHPDFGKESITASLAMFYKGYDSDCHYLDSPATLQKLIDRATQEKLPLYVNLSRANVLDENGRNILTMLYDPKLFKKFPPLYGTDLESTRWVYEFIRN
jgi:hypothetical protein